MSSTAYWNEFELARTESTFGRTLESRLGRSHYRTFTLRGVTWSTIHLAAALSTRDRGGRRAGNRVQLVFMHPDGRQFREFKRARAQIDAVVPGLEWREEEYGKRSHVEVWKPDNLMHPERWNDDFEWMLDHLQRFQQHLAPFAVEAVRRSA